jgi:hypothetical protein
MKKNRLHMFIIYCFITNLAIFAYCNCYAVKITIEEIDIPCSKDFRDAPEYKYEGEPKTQYILETIGIKEIGIDGIIGCEEYWNKILDKPGSNIYLNYEVHIAAECIVSKYASYRHNMWPPGEVFSCRKGEGLSITMLAPTDPNPDKYHYIAKLTKIYDDDNELIIQPRIPIEETIQKDLPTPITTELDLPENHYGELN